VQILTPYQYCWAWLFPDNTAAWRLFNPIGETAMKALKRWLAIGLVSIATLSHPGLL